jgi:hypothetical protein
MPIVAGEHKPARKRTRWPLGVAAAAAVLVGLLPLVPLVHPVHIGTESGDLIVNCFWESDWSYGPGYHDGRHFAYGWRSRQLVVKVPVGSKTWYYLVEYRTP